MPQATPPKSDPKGGAKPPRPPRKEPKPIFRDFASI